MIDFLIILMLPFVIAVAVVIFFMKTGKITPIELVVMLAAPALVAGCMVAAFQYQETAATELWNGQITQRERVKVSCSHSYQCHCRMVPSGSGKNASYSEKCDTCYEHSYDVDWNLYSSTNEKIEIDRVDRQGLQMPDRWRIAYPGEPFSSEHSYQNYLLVNRGSVLFGGVGDTKRFAALIPQYPKVFDFYRVNPVIVTGGVPVDMKNWTWLIRELNKRVSGPKQVNVLIVLAKTSDRSYAKALSTAWDGGQKNDLIVVIGTEDGNKIAFAEIVSWTPAQDLKVVLRDRIEQIGDLGHRDEIVNAIESEVNGRWKRMHMKEYKYLLATAEIPFGEKLAAIIFCSLLEIGICFWAVKNDLVAE